MNGSMIRFAPALVLLFAAACSQTSAPLSPTLASVSESGIVTGTILATNGGQALAGVSLTTAFERVTSDSSGRFALHLMGGGFFPVTISGPAIVTRTIGFDPLTANTIAPDVFLQDGSFDLQFYRAFARNGFEQPSQLQPLRRWQRAPAVYLKTTDEAGRPIDPVTLDTTEAALIDAARLWTGDRFGLAGVTRGTGTREGSPGWITVRWASQAATGRCGLSTVGVDGGWIELNPLGACSCGGPSRVYPRLVRHELGHALGYYHTDSPNDVMYGQQIAATACDLRPSAREQQHAKYVYRRPSGNTDPDHDPDATPSELRSLLPVLLQQ